MRSAPPGSTINEVYRKSVLGNGDRAYVGSISEAVDRMREDHTNVALGTEVSRWETPIILSKD